MYFIKYSDPINYSFIYFLYFILFVYTIIVIEGL